MHVLGVIPARGGSKGIPRKNIKLLLGRPLIAYSIVPALESAALADVVVTSDDPEILEAAAAYGAATLERPEALAGDDAPTPPVVAHALAAMEDRTGRRYDAVVLLQPTTPLRTAADIDGAVRKLMETDADAVVSVVESTGINPEWMKLIKDDRLVDCDPTLPEMGRRQDAQKIYIRNGSIYAARTEVFRTRQSFKAGVCRPYVMPEATWVNIDTPRDWILAEALMRDKDWSWVAPWRRI
ncbi:MAG: hypothetical protein A3B34_00970 [Candidatus Sungbacteria bacterium RIFCSPLOWO2_01_FULL_54_21]|uniref:Acylneuraminate cytidylyltransferase n=2 Tax=Candidatus Sungiibacteriota TaxID=1817917 RepID=A0A1G2LB24_9BACT|nr:MAG: hypothetical protein A2679_03535 [Candidatus Sungbacteria bacterium RIFCSPHIGHO2_01_FULL_54_26]OHA04012.1 MAG: hypothetical protein A3C92_03660 [Candidatus Sungbacteria bacterium RIFCSPHIGHO2_02_FULL_53_17]OHA07989.1 MAG: hypothetical protein A3B34_00970 [Candidatus Sungbacteria bacterium RIFCSPLOWO2_01_FULL_54_21]